ncbi:putative transporter SVOPL isoform X2 [Battus philenor]|uniref:putative transporter SVOPL isoform X2 n=1 Tax=Battus philenor TaxID=42288 RepID=UPI0035D0C6C4
MAANKVKTVSEIVENGNENAASLDHALHVAGLGWYNIVYSLVLALFLVAAIVDPVGYSYVLPAAKCDLGMTDEQRGFLASVPYIACPAAVPYTFIGEIVPMKYRDVTLSVTNALQILGATLVPLFAWAILPLEFSANFGSYDFRPWRLLTIMYGSIFIIAALLLSCGPESPKYLLSRGKHEEALNVLKTIYSKNKRKSMDEYPIKFLKTEDFVKKDEQGFFSSIKAQSLPLFKAPYLKWMALNSFIFFGLFATLNGLYVWLPDVLNRVLTGDGEGLTACKVIDQRLNETEHDNTVCDDSIDTRTFLINSIANVCCSIVAIVASSTVKIIGKKTLLISVLFLIGLFCILINVVTNDILFAIFISSIPVLGLGIGPVNAYAVQIFPTHLRGMAVGLSMMMGRVGSIAGSNVAGILLNAFCEVTFYLFGGFLMLCGASALLLPGSKKETKEDVTSKL